MKFTVKFYSKTNTAISLDTKNLGLNALEKARNEIGVCFEASIFDSSVDSLHTDISFEISEERAKISGSFSETNHFTVQCPAESFNNCVDEIISVTRKEVTDEITSVTINRVINTDKIFEQWKSLHFPEIIF